MQPYRLNDYGERILQEILKGNFDFTTNRNAPIAEALFSLGILTDAIAENEALEKTRAEERLRVQAIVDTWATAVPKFEDGEMVSYFKDYRGDWLGCIEEIRRRTSVWEYKWSLYMDSPFMYYVDWEWRYEWDLWFLE